MYLGLHDIIIFVLFRLLKQPSLCIQLFMLLTTIVSALRLYVKSLGLTTIFYDICDSQTSLLTINFHTIRVANVNEFDINPMSIKFLFSCQPLMSKNPRWRPPSYRKGSHLTRNELVRGASSPVIDSYSFFQPTRVEAVELSGKEESRAHRKTDGSSSSGQEMTGSKNSHVRLCKLP